ncbi:hypothetical protein C9374_014740 [Naegleria lovaniensis]|uniref:Uncharacterized protein n=1 Tax=Naegleria lovaniensis TaxID=51637 RepID=A0AA88GA86_NAELO|nr:uncharacterized protein C9374_014740 [Naegleria lovaniensis]KAG2370620.1 hypothetical protein C9374_014740 [Naegleria lovaniensis]
MGILRSDKIVELTQDATTSRFYTAITSGPFKNFDQTHYLLMQNQKTSNEKYFFVLSNPCSHTSSSKGGNDNNTFDEIPTLEDSLDLKNNRARISIVDVNIEEIYYPYTVLFSNNQSSDWLTDSNSIQLPPLELRKLLWTWLLLNR